MAASLQHSLLTGNAVAILTTCAYHCASCVQANCLYVECSHFSEHAVLGLECYTCVHDMLQMERKLCSGSQKFVLLDWTQSINVLHRIILKVANGPCCTH